MKYWDIKRPRWTTADFDVYRFWTKTLGLKTSQLNKGLILGKHAYIITYNPDKPSLTRIVKGAL
jgi:hypothetical protein